MKPLFLLIFVALASVTALGVYSVTAYNRSTEELNELHGKIVSLDKKFLELKDLMAALAQQRQNASSTESASSTREVVDSVALRVADLEKKVQQAVAQNAGSDKSTPAVPVAKSEQKPLESVVEDAVRKNLQERDAVRSEQMRENFQTEGVQFIAQKITGLSESQKQVIAPVMADHATKLAEMWWLNTAVDEQGKPLSSEERIKRSDKLRAELTEKVKANLTPAQQMELQTWVAERKEKKDKNERVDGNGVWNWLFY